MKQSRWTVPVLLLPVLLLLNCSRGGEAVGKLRDDLGRPVPRVRSGAGVVSLAPNATEMAVFLGCGKRLTGATRFCKPLVSGMRVRNVGGMLSPNLERIALLKPALVLLSFEGSSPRTETALKKLSLSTYVVRVENFQGLLDSLRRLSVVLSVSNTDSISRLRILARNLQGRLRGKRLFFHIPGGRTVYTFGKKTLLGDLLYRAGAVNVAAGLSGRFPRVSLERLALLRPQTVVVLGKGSGAAAAVQRRFWKRIAPQSRVVFAPDPAFFRPGPGMVRALSSLADRL